MPVALTAPPKVGPQQRFTASVELRGVTPGVAVEVKLYADDDPSFAAQVERLTADGAGQAHVSFQSLRLGTPGSRALVAKATDDLGLPLGTDVQFIQVG